MPEVKPKRAPSAKTRGVIDRIEDNKMAVVMVGEDGKESIDLPLSILPAGASDGDHLTLTIALNKESRAKAEGDVRTRQERLEKRSTMIGKKDFKL